MSVAGFGSSETHEDQAGCVPGGLGASTSCCATGSRFVGGWSGRCTSEKSARGSEACRSGGASGNSVPEDSVVGVVSREVAGFSVGGLVLALVTGGGDGFEVGVSIR